MHYNVYILCEKKQGAKMCYGVLLFLQRIKISRLYACQCTTYFFLEGHKTLMTLIASEQWNGGHRKGMEETAISVPCLYCFNSAFVHVLSI